MKKKKALILKTAGTNNDSETAIAFTLAGASSEIAHINEFISGRKNLLDYDILVIPGGFSYGDYISAGKIFANKLRYKLNAQFDKFLSERRIVLGICNGFQVLVKMGLLPFDEDKQAATLMHNDSEKFECRWVHLKTIKNDASLKLKMKNFLFKNLPDVIQLPVAHGEGKFFADNDVVNKIKNSGQILFKYCTPDGNETAKYPLNPNGSVENIAALTNPSGNIIGIMPHPERFVIGEHHPLWTRKRTEPWGLVFIRNIVDPT